jgi:GntR family transcriptional regulator
MRISLNHHSGEPICRQIVDAIRLCLSLGELPPSTKLPSILRMVSDLSSNTRTVIKAYEEQEKAGLAIMRHGEGVFVTEPQNVRPARERRKTLAGLAERLMAEASEMGATSQTGR